jgi:hypothetical protein
VLNPQEIFHFSLKHHHITSHTRSTIALTRRTSVKQVRKEEEEVIIVSVTFVGRKN